MPESNLERRDMTTRALTLRADTLDDKARTVEAVLTTDTPTRVFDWSEMAFVDEILVMSGAEYPAQVPLLRVHNRWSTDDVMGSVRDIHNGSNQLVGRLHFATDEATERDWQKTREGHLTDVSIGYRVLESEMIKQGTTKTIAGRKWTATDGPLRVSTRWQLKEASMVPIGADPNAKIREDNAGRKPPELEADMPSKTKPKNEDVVEDTGERVEAVETKPAAKPEPVEAVDADAIRAEAVKAERKRVAELRKLAGDDVSVETVQRAIDEGWDASRASSEFLKDIRENREPAVTVGADRSEGMIPGLSAALCQRAGIILNDDERQAAEEFRGIGLQDSARLCLRHTGDVPVNVDTLFGRAIATGTFTELLGTSATKSLQASYTEYPSTFQTWAGTRDVADFKTYKDIKLSAFASTELVNEAGEIAHGVISEKYEEYAALTYGKRFAITRQMFYNDDLDGFLRIPAQLGIAAKRKIDDLGYADLYSNSGVGPTMTEDSQALFYASRTTPNYKTGSGGALGDAGMTACKTLMRKIQGLASETINVYPVYLLVPPELEHTALKLVQSQELMAHGSTDTTLYTKNIHQGTLKVIVEPRLSGATNGTTAWYLIADPRQVPHYVVVYLRGARTPTLERHDPPEILGLGWRVYHDCGVAALDWRGILRAKGA